MRMAPLFAGLATCSALLCGLLATDARAQQAGTPGPEGGEQRAPSTAQPAAPGAAPAAETFEIREFRVLGNSVLSVRDVERAVYGYTGPKRTITDVQAARGALEQSYRAAGYGTVFVDIPEQDVGEGIVRLRVTEGRLDRIRVTGARYFSNRKLLAALPTLQPGAVPQLPALQGELADANRQSTDRAVTPILKAGRTPGTVDVELRVKDALPLHGSVAVNDRYTANTSRLRTVIDLSYGNLFQDFQSVSFEYQTAPKKPSDARVLALTYLAPVDAEHDLLALYAVDTNSDVAAVGTLSVLGKGRIYGTRLIHPFATAAPALQSLALGLDYKDFSETINLLTGGRDRTPIRYTNWSLQYSANERAPRHATLFNLTANFGLRGAPNDAAAFDYKRFDARPNYAYLRASVEHSRPLALGTSLGLRLSGQLTDQPLISNEQFGAGGVDTVRGYLESAALGDTGVAGSVEIHGPVWPLAANREKNHWMLLGFYDAGFVDIIEPLPQQLRRMRLASAGVGLRLAALGALEGSLDWAYPLRSEGTVQRGDSRLLFQLRLGL